MADGYLDPMDVDASRDGLAQLFAERRGISLAALVAVNLIPLIGVFCWRWDVGSLVILYWSEKSGSSGSWPCLSATASRWW